MQSGLRIARVFGIPIYLHYTWAAVFALVTVNLTVVYGEPGFLEDWAPAGRAALAAGTAVFFFTSVVLHELAHSVVAIANRIPVHSITLYVFGGVAAVTREPSRPRVEFAVAVAGPVMSLLLAGLFGLLALAFGAARPLEVAASWLALINLSLGLFNLLPGFPMDGGRLLRALLWARTGSFDRATGVATTVGRVFGFLLMAGGAAEVLLTRNLGGLWLMLLGWFIENAAAASSRELGLRRALEGVTASAVMEPGCPEVPAHVTVDVLVNGYLLPSGRRCFLVRDGDALVGLVSTTDARKVPQASWPTAHVTTIMTPMAGVITAAPDTPALDVLTLMVERNVNQVPVMTGGTVTGLVTRERLLHTVRLRAETRRT